MDLQQNLSKSFKLIELTRSAKADQLGIKNEPNEVELKCLKELCTKLLQPIRDEIGVPIRINSGLRGELLNKAVGGVSTSAHRLGYAADIVAPAYKGGDVKALCNFIADLFKRKKIKYDQIIFEKVGGAVWCHIGLKNEDGKQRCQNITIIGKKAYPGFV